MKMTGQIPKRTPATTDVCHAIQL